MSCRLAELVTTRRFQGIGGGGQGGGHKTVRVKLYVDFTLECRIGGLCDMVGKAGLE